MSMSGKEEKGEKREKPDYDISLEMEKEVFKENRVLQRSPEDREKKMSSKKINEIRGMMGEILRGIEEVKSEQRINSKEKR